MQIALNSPVLFKRYFDCNQSINKANVDVNKINNSSKLMSYPSCYYISFGKNKDAFAKMKQTKDDKKLNELLQELTPKARENFNGLLSRFEKEGLTKKDYLKACIKQPPLFQSSPDTIETNVKELVKRFQDEGLTVEVYLKACIKQPPLFQSSPDTIETNVKELVKRFEDEGLTKKSYLKACINQPSLFHCSSDTIETNVREFVKRFQDEGLTAANYTKACVAQPPLFYMSPDTIEANVRGLVKQFENEGLTVEDYLKACVKFPSLFYSSPDTIAEHIKVMQFGNLNSNAPLENDEFWTTKLKSPIKFCCSSEYLMAIELIIPKMFENNQVPKELKGSKILQKLQTYLESHPDKKYVLNVKGSQDDINLLKQCIDKINTDANNRFEICHI
ncbi:hypothetical protein IJ670_00640 [bacterium]|nr:hypothetical protein [bacterium]